MRFDSYDGQEIIKLARGIGLECPVLDQAAELIDHADKMVLVQKEIRDLPAVGEEVGELARARGTAKSLAKKALGLTAADPVGRKEQALKLTEEARKLARRNSIIVFRDGRQELWEALSARSVAIYADLARNKVRQGIQTFEEAALLGYRDQWQRTEDLTAQRAEHRKIVDLIVKGELFAPLPGWFYGQNKLSLYKEDGSLKDIVEETAASEKKRQSRMREPDPFAVSDEVRLRRVRKERNAALARADRQKAEAQAARAEVEADLEKARKASRVFAQA